MELKIIKTKIKEEFGKEGKNYATLAINDEEIGFINEDGIYLRLYSSYSTFGVFNKLFVGEKRTFVWLCQFVEKNFEAIYDREDLHIKKETFRRFY